MIGQLVGDGGQRGGEAGQDDVGRGHLRGRGWSVAVAKAGRWLALCSVFGAGRLVWNGAIRYKDEAWRADGAKLNAVVLSREFTQLKAAPETVWLADMPRMSRMSFD